MEKITGNELSTIYQKVTQIQMIADMVYAMEDRNTMEAILTRSIAGVAAQVVDMLQNFIEWRTDV